METSSTQLQMALVRGRVAALAQMSKADAAGFDWQEEAITQTLLTSIYPDAIVVPFNRRQEHKTGADWLWWFVDDDGCAFGMLVQAKRVTIKQTGWDFGFEYDNGNQRRSLMQTAKDLDIVPTYALYLGTPAYRGSSPLEWWNFVSARTGCFRLVSRVSGVVCGGVVSG